MALMVASCRKNAGFAITGYVNIQNEALLTSGEQIVARSGVLTVKSAVFGKN